MDIKQRKYKTILADPPWDSQQRCQKGAIHHYGLMTIPEIADMPVADFADNNSCCWLWVTNNTLRYGYDVLEAWGFTPRSTFTWCKPRLGLGNYLRNSTEHILLGTRGSVELKFHGQQNWGFYPVQDHSHKPEEVYDVIERCSYGPYLELFARRRRNGWDAWGNEIESDIVINRYPVTSYSGKIHAGVTSE